MRAKELRLQNEGWVSKNKPAGMKTGQNVCKPDHEYRRKGMNGKDS